MAKPVCDACRARGIVIYTDKHGREWGWDGFVWTHGNLEVRDYSIAWGWADNGSMFKDLYMYVRGQGYLTAQAAMDAAGGER